MKKSTARESTQHLPAGYLHLHVCHVGETGKNTNHASGRPSKAALESVDPDYSVLSDNITVEQSPRIGKFGWETTPHCYYFSTLSF